MAQIGSLKVVELVKQVEDLNEVPYLTFGQEIQQKKNLVRYYQLVQLLIEAKGALAKGEHMPLPQSSYVNVLVDDCEMDFYRPRFIVYPKSSAKVNRFGSDLDQLGLDIESDFVSIIKRIRADLKIEGSSSVIKASTLGIGITGDKVIPVDPRNPKAFILSLVPVLNCEAVFTNRAVGDKNVYAYDIDLPYFSA